MTMRQVCNVKMRVYICGIKAFLTLDGLNLVTCARKERIHAYRQAEDKARCLVAGLLLRRICGVTDDCQLKYVNDKPYLKDGGMYFNISHSGDYVVLAVSGSEVGVDIEKVSPYFREAADLCFTPRERERLKQEGCDETFYRLWTAKEAVMKGSGLGFSLLPETFCVLPLDSSAHRIDGRIWFLDWLFHDGHIICGAVENMAEKIELMTISADDCLH